MESTTGLTKRSRAERIRLYREQAQSLREEAEGMAHQELRRHALNIADRFDALADTIEKEEQSG